MPYILFILGLLFANLKTVDTVKHQTPRTQTNDRNDPGDDRDFIITDLETP